jgi:drug/metabolite transporter (DMT)-like permease
MARSFPHNMNEISLFTHISFIGIVVVVPFAFYYDVYALLFSSHRLPADTGVFNMIFLFVLNGLAYSTYNLMSFMVLMRTDIATHAVLNVFRRVVIIIFTSIYFGTVVSTLNMFGICLAISGVLLFNRIRKVVDKD